MDYATLIGPKTTKGSIAEWIVWTDTKMPIEAILEEAQTFIFDNMRVTEMKQAQTLALPAGAVSVALPARLVTTISIQDQYMTPLKARDLKSLMLRRSKDDAGNWTQADAPLFYSQTATAFEFDMAPSENIDLTLAGFFRPEPLGPTNQTNFLTEKYPHLLRTAILIFVADFLNDDAKYARYTTRYQALLAQAMQSEDLNMLGLQYDMDYLESRI
jgi:hypothetical protein